MGLGSSTVLGQPYAPMGRTMIGGLLTSTFLTLLLVPLFYTFLDDFRTALKRMYAGVVAQRPDMAVAETGNDD